MKLSKAPFGNFQGQHVDLYTLENDNGVVMKITNYGGTITSLVVPDKAGNAADITCGFDTLDEYFAEAYKANSPYFGCLVGRYAGRVKDGKFSFDGTGCTVDTNAGPNHIHGGADALDKRVWSAEPIEEAGRVGLKLRITSPDGDNGYPGNLEVTVEICLNNANEISIDYSGTTDKATPLAMTHHAYFNLNGFTDKVLDHKAMIAADKFLVPDDTDVPVGEVQAVAGTVWDYNLAKPVADAFEVEPKGFEHFYVFPKGLSAIEKVAEVFHEGSGRKLEVSTTEPGMLFYTGFYTSDDLKRSDDVRFGQFRAFCCEAARYPNGPNLEGAPGTVLHPGETYTAKTIYKLSWS